LRNSRAIQCCNGVGLTPPPRIQHVGSAGESCYQVRFALVQAEMLLAGGGARQAYDACEAALILINALRARAPADGDTCSASRLEQIAGEPNIL